MRSEASGGAVSRDRALIDPCYAMIRGAKYTTCIKPPGLTSSPTSRAHNYKSAMQRRRHHHRIGKDPGSTVRLLSLFSRDRRWFVHHSGGPPQADMHLHVLLVL